MDKGKIGATLRIDLPRYPGTELPYARTVSSYLTSDTSATNIVFALYTSQHCGPGRPKPHAATIAALTGVLAENGITIRDGIFVGDDTYSPYDSEPGQDISLPISTTEYSRVNAEFIYRGSTIEPTNRIILPAPTDEADHAIAVEKRMNTIRGQAPQEASLQASQLWTTMLDSNDFPTDDDCATLIANFQFPHIRDRLMADIPGIDEPSQHILFAQTTTPPNWSRIEWAQQLLLHAYTRTSPQHAAPILTTIGYINWWEGRGSKAHQYLQLALDTDPSSASPDSPTTCSEQASSPAGTPTTTPPTKPTSTCRSRGHGHEIIACHRCLPSFTAMDAVQPSSEADIKPKK